MSNQTLVTRDSIQQMLNSNDKTFVMHVVGRALVGIFKRQTEDEKVSNSTNKHNNIGFAGCDARSGSLTAKSYLKRGMLEDWQVERWTKISTKTQFARLCKYHTQLNQIAQEKQEQRKK